MPLQYLFRILIIYIDYAGIALSEQHAFAAEVFLKILMLSRTYMIRS